MSGSLSEWSNIPLGVAVAILLFRELAKELRRKREEAVPPTITNGKSGDKSTEYWESKLHEIIYTELDRHICPKLNDILERDKRILDLVAEVRWRRREDHNGD